MPVTEIDETYSPFALFFTATFVLPFIGAIGGRISGLYCLSGPTARSI